MVPPSNYPFSAITAPPAHTIMNTISKSKVLSSDWVADESTTDKIRQNINGPHKSQFLSYAPFSSLNFGNNTYFIL